VTARPSALRRRPPGHFFVGGRAVTTPGGHTLLVDQMYVEPHMPDRVAGEPVVLIHGGCMTGAHLTWTPDGRPGWAQHFLALGHPVYVVDQPGRGRSRYHHEYHGSLVHYEIEACERAFSACAELGDWPNARLHTQWPGSGRRGDPVFDAFYASLVGHLADHALMERLMRSCGTALLEEIGPATLVTHSQSALAGWIIADAVPHLVSAIVAVEPYGPPERPPTSEAALQHAVPPLRDTITYNPLHATESGILTRLAPIPVLVITGEASYFDSYDALLVQILRRAGVDAEHVRLGDVGIRGNGHMMMLELNNGHIAEYLSRWMSSWARSLRPGQDPVTSRAADA
jgi:pimeloyl-ACP methyl ester carboxylesterase